MAKWDSKLLDALKNYVGSNLKQKIIKKATEQITRWLFSKLSFLAWGPLGSIVSYFVTKGVIFIIDETLIGAHVLYIYGDATIDRKKVEKVIEEFYKYNGVMTDEEITIIDAKFSVVLPELMELGSLKLRK